MPADNARPFDRIVGYVRVSTKTQGMSGLGLEAQRAAIMAYAQKIGVSVVEVLEEIESGTRADRPKLAEAVRLCDLTGAALVAAKVDRFGRKAKDLFALRDARFPVVAVDTPNADGFLFGVLALVAEKERDSISERTRAALAAAKARGVKLGSPEGFQGVVYRGGGEAAKSGADEFARRLAPMLQQARASGKSLNAIAAELKAKGIRTARGGAWTATAVRNVLNRFAG